MKGKKKSIMEPKFKSLMQIGILVENLEEAVKNYEAMGISGWDISALDNTVPPFEDLKFDGKEIPEKGQIIKTAMATVFGVEIELIEPVAEGTAYYKWIKEHGPGIHHMAFDVGDDYEKFVSECKDQTGKEPWVHGTGIHGLMDFSYVDLRKQMGIIVECYKNKQPGKPYLRFDKEAELVEA